ncbi:MAG: hypothetical protein FD123_2431 [Bacteroidetes bacterium]|nr:MAG: hypothetical protein FD123_2431 [Bacteroidota bacterium]
MKKYLALTAAVLFSGSYCIAQAPEINVSGNGITIVDGDLVPAAADHTDFGSVLTCNGAIVRTFTIQNQGSGNLNISSVNISGAHTYDFALISAPASVVPASGSTTFQVRFTPSASGIRTVSVIINNNDANEAAYNFNIQGTDNSDTVPPVANCRNISLYLNASGIANIVPAMIDNGSTDNCSIASMNVSTIGFNWSNVGNNNVTLTVTDGRGNISTCTGIVTVLDSTRPVAVSQDIVITLDSAGNASITGAMVDNGSTDACGIASMTVNPGSFTCSNIGMNNVVFTVTDNSGNTSSCNAVVTVLGNLSATMTVNHVSCTGSNNGQATVAPFGGTGPYSYSWLPAGGTGTTAGALAPGTYTCTISDAIGCSITESISITEPSPLVLLPASHSSATCNGIADGRASVLPATGGTGNYTYDWMPGNPNGDGTTDITELLAGTWTCTVTDINYCSVSQIINVEQTYTLVATSAAGNVLCSGGNTQVTVSASGTMAPYTGTGVFTVTAGTYQYTVTDALGCMSTTSATVSEPALLNTVSSVTPIACNGGNATVTVTGSGGTGAYSGTGTFTVPAGTYSYTITDANACSATTTITITEPAPLSSASSATAIACNGETATVTVTGAGGTNPYSGAGTFTVAAGIYSYTVTDANGCASTTTVTLTEPAAISTSVTSADVSCFGGSGGSADLTMTGGTSPYSFNWNNGTYFTEDISGVPAGIYTGVFTDANGCTNSGTVIIAEPSFPLTTIFSASGPVTCGGTEGAINISMTGGTPGYSFLWNTSDTTEDLSGIGAGVYTCTVTDANGCTTMVNTNLNDPNAPVVTLAVSVDTTCQSATAAFTLNGASPAGGTFSGPGVTGNIFDPMQANPGMNIITYTYTSSSGCTGTAIDSILVDLCTTGIASSEKNNLFTISPNPNNGTFMLQLSTTGTADILVCNALGQLISMQQAQADMQQQFHLADPGMYMITVIAADGQRTSQRVIVSR